MVRGQLQSENGTSASTPCFSGMISLLNDIRLQQGKGPLGFLNPMLYEIGAKFSTGFLDVTEGVNGVDYCPGFPARPGWDALSGWGVPNFAVLKDLVLKY